MAEGARARCYFCSLLCPIDAERTPADRFLPQYPKREDGLRGLCGRGHTACELAGHPERRNLALLRTGGVERSLPLAQALAELAALLKGVWDPGAVALLVDGNLPAEDIAAGGLFAEHCLEGAAWSVFLPPSDEALLRGLGGSAEPPSPDELAQADATLVVGDPFTSHPVIAGPLLKAKLASREATLTVIDSIANVTSRFATQWFAVPPGLEPWALARVARELGAPRDALGPLADDEGAAELDALSSDLARLAETLRGAERPVLLLAPELTRTGAPVALAVAARAIAQAAKAKVLALTCYGNARAALALAANAGAKPLVELLRRLQAGELRALMVLGGDPTASLPSGLSREALAKLEVLVVAESLPTLTGEGADVVLPLALAAEAGGTVVDCFGRVGVAEPLALPPRGAVAGRALLAALAQELATALPTISAPEAGSLELPAAPPTESLLKEVSAPREVGEEEFWLLGTSSPVHYDVSTLTRFASWARVMEPAAQAAVSPELGRQLGVEAGDELRLSSAAAEVSLACVVREDLGERIVVASGNFPEVRGLFGWPVPVKGDRLPSGPVTVTAKAVSPMTAGSEHG